MGEVLDNLKASIFGFLRSQLLLSLITYLITLVGLIVMGMNYSLAIALLVVIVDIMPILALALYLFRGGLSAA